MPSIRRQYVADETLELIAFPRRAADAFTKYGTRCRSPPVAPRRRQELERRSRRTTRTSIVGAGEKLHSPRSDESSCRHSPAASKALGGGMKKKPAWDDLVERPSSDLSRNSLTFGCVQGSARHRSRFPYCVYYRADRLLSSRFSKRRATPPGKAGSSRHA